MKTNNEKGLVQLWVPEPTKKTVKKLAEKFDRYEYEFVHDAVKYFEKSGYNPAEMEDVEAPAEELKKLRNAFISFMRKHESEYLRPLVDKLDASISVLVDTVKSLPRQSKETPSPKIEKGKHKFILPDSAMEDAPGEIKPRVVSKEIEYKIQWEKKEMELNRLKEYVKGLSKKFNHKTMGGGFTATLSKLEYEEMQTHLSAP